MNTTSALGIVGVVSIAAFSPQIANSAEDVRGTALLYGAVMDSACEENTYQLETALLAAWAAKVALNTVVGFASSFLEQATKETTVTRAANAPGMLYRWDPSLKAWSSNSCIRFWYGRQQGNELPTTATPAYGAPPAGAEDPWTAITGRWKKLGLVDVPYVYGEVRLVLHAETNAVTLQPVVLYVRKPPESRSIFRKTTSMSVALDLRALTGDPFATHVMQLPDVEEAPVLVRGLAGTRGLASAWAVAPPPPEDPPKPSSSTAVPVTALVTFTSTSDGTLFGKTLASAFKSQQEGLVEAALPKTKEQKAEAAASVAAEKETSMLNVFSSEADVLSAQAALTAATDEALKPGLALALRKAQYIADLRRRAAGLTPKYLVAGP